MPTKSTQAAVAEIQKRVRAVSPLKDPVFISRYVGSVGHEDREKNEQSQLQFLGLTMPQVRALANAEYSFVNLPIEQQMRIWLDLYHSSDVHEELALALQWLSHPKRAPLLLDNVPEVFRLQKRVDNWAISDSVSEFVAALSELSPEAHHLQLRAWNQSKNPWDRRQSLVGMYCYAQKRKKPLAAKKAIPLIRKLIADPHFFVQKAVGWSLRELAQVDPEAQRTFLLKNLSKLSSAAFSTATEKFDVADKNTLKAKRALRRKKARTEN